MLRLDEADPGSFDSWPTVRVTETTAHHRRSISRTGIVEPLHAYGGVDEGLPAHGLGRWMERVANFRDGPGGAFNPDQPAAQGIAALELGCQTFAAKILDGAKRPVAGRDWHHNSV
jgi:hypothetical protein